MLTSI
jgi:hypothetical protein